MELLEKLNVLSEKVDGLLVRLNKEQETNSLLKQENEALKEENRRLNQQNEAVREKVENLLGRL